MSRILPILFNAEMVRAILQEIDPKKATRRLIKKFIPSDARWGYTAFTPKGYISCRGTFAGGYGEKFYKLPCEPGDILYVRETWAYHEGAINGIVYKARCPEKFVKTKKWRPSIHMPKQAARIWLKVTDVRVEQLHDIDEDGAKAEGANWKNGKNVGWKEKMQRTAVERFAEIWDSTIKKSDIGLYDWESDPWVWVIKFERCKKPYGI